MSGKLSIPNISYEMTVRRLAKIQGHLSNRPRSERLKDKVCIITGVGSLTGIGYVLCRTSMGGFNSCHVYQRRASALLFAHEGTLPSLYIDTNRVSKYLTIITDINTIGARALYLLDFDGTNLPGLKDTINKQYPDVKVSRI